MHPRCSQLNISSGTYTITESQAVWKNLKQIFAESSSAFSNAEKAFVELARWVQFDQFEDDYTSDISMLDELDE